MLLIPQENLTQISGENTEDKPDVENDVKTEPNTALQRTLRSSTPQVSLTLPPLLSIPRPTKPLGSGIGASHPIASHKNE